jgi:8-oxo-dGTP diphosphatase
MKEKEKQEAVRFLKKNEIYNLSIIGFIKENSLQRLIRKGNSYLAQGSEAERWIYFSSEDEREFTDLLQNLNAEDKYFGAVDKWQLAHLTKGKEVDWLINAFQYHYPVDKEIPGNKYKVQKLTQKDSEYIFSQSVYKDVLTVEYLSERIEKSVSSGIRENGKLIAWALTHDDSSLGSMHVLEEYRGRGYAKEITISLIRQCRAMGKIPFLQCENKNIPAQKLVEGIGFVKDRNVSWLKLK